MTYREKKLKKRVGICIADSLCCTHEVLYTKTTVKIKYTPIKYFKNKNKRTAQVSQSRHPRHHRSAVTGTFIPGLCS